MKVPVRFSLGVVVLLAVLLTAPTGRAAAQVTGDENDELHGIAPLDPRLSPQAETQPLDELRATLAAPVAEGWDRFLLDAGSPWAGSIDRRTGRLEFAEGGGIPWVPGAGNRLTAADVAKKAGGRTKADLPAMEAIARGFLPRVATLLGVDPKELVLNPGRSAHPADYLWFVDFDIVRDGLPVEGARVVFRVNNGNLIQFGSENLPSLGATVPAQRVSLGQAMATVSDHVGGINPWDEIVDPGSLRLLPVAIEDARYADGFEFGRGRGLALVWQVVFRREGEAPTWRARVDATTGELRELVDLNDYGRITGGVYKTAPSAGESVLPMPFADYAPGLYTNSAGLYSNGTASTLSGLRVRITDSCGSISRAADGPGNILFGTSGGTDCTTPASGGAGNTHAARTTYYHTARAKENGLGWLPTNSWLSAQLTANTNINNTCNANWNGSTINFYRSGGGCGNTGELPAVVLHEYGHGLDWNDGNGSSVDKGTGETYGDFTAALVLRNSCMGSGFRTTNCTGYGDACTSCTGIRDIDYAKHASGVAHTVSNFTQTKCPTSGTYQGPCGREGHCESYVSSEALWDLAARDLPSPNTNTSWNVAERLWFVSRATATKAFNCTASGTWTSNGCFTGSFWRTMRAADDDDGNLNNGTPHGGALYAAFNRHGIACTTDTAASTTFRGVTQTATPTLTLTPGVNQTTVSWSGGGAVFDVYRSEISCSAGFVKAANDRTGTSWVDTSVAGGSTYYYFVTSHPSGNEAAHSNPSTCKTVTATPPPAAPASLTVQNEFCYGYVTLTWAASTGATYYELYQAPNSSYTSQVLIYSGANLTLFHNHGTGTYWYRVRACTTGGCGDYRTGNTSHTYYSGCA